MKKNDLTGNKFGSLTVVKYAGKSKWVCICDCGNTTCVKTSNLTSGHTKSCGCLSKLQSAKNGRKSLIDLTGQRFGKLVVQRYFPDLKKWECICDCGKITYVSANNLKKGTTKSCGCAVTLEKAQEANIVNGTNIGNIKSKSTRSNVGIRGVYYCKSRGLYVAHIGFKGKQYQIKTSTNIEECIAARQEAEKRIFGEFLEWYEEYKKNKEQED
ncbi:MAG: hypothetical protein J6A05_05050 [Oscillospiraceae bacterium]|nr:hypothetical protein [Oscillospiraceae bacterium]